MAFNTQYVNLNPYEAAQLQRTANQQSPIDAALQGLNQGIQLQQLPQTLRDQQLQRHLNNILVGQKIYDLQHPEEAAVRDLTKQLTLKGDLNPDLGIGPAPAGTVGQVINNPGAITPDQQASLPSSDTLAMRKLASEMGGADIQTSIPTAPAAGVPETPIVAFGRQTGLTSNPNIPAQAAQDKLDRQIALLNSKPVHSVLTKEGYGFNPVTGELEQVSLPGATTGLDQQRKDQLAAEVLRKSNEASNILNQKESFTSNQNDLNRANANTLADKRIQSQAGGEASKLTDKLAKEAQSNKSYQSFRTVNDALDGLKATLEYAQSNPGDQTGIKSSAVDSFNRIINPNSIVRQTAFNQTTAGQSLLNKAENFLNGFVTGQTITPQQIQSMIDIAEKYKSQSMESAQRELKVLRNRGDKAGIDPNDYIPDLFQNNPSTASPPTTQTAPVRVNSKAERDALAPGTVYVSPSGAISTR